MIKAFYSYPFFHTVSSKLSGKKHEWPHFKILSDFLSKQMSKNFIHNKKLKSISINFSATGTSEKWQPTFTRWKWSVNTSHLKVVQMKWKNKKLPKSCFFSYKQEWKTKSRKIQDWKLKNWRKNPVSSYLITFQVAS